MKKRVKKTIKKRGKAKRKVVKSKKKLKKRTKRVRKKRRKRKKKLFMEDVYAILNKVQITKKTLEFATTFVEAGPIENTIRDLDLVYKKKEMKTQVVFIVSPSEQDFEENLQEELKEIEFLDDEIAENGQIFP
jgi:hypothetical protein